MSEKEFDPSLWGKRVGEKCQFCGNSFKKDRSTQFCACGIVCHEQCFYKKYFKEIQIGKVLICIKCKREIDFSYSTAKVWKCQKKISCILLIGLFTILAILSAISLLIQLPLKLPSFPFWLPIAVIGISVVSILVVLIKTLRIEEVVRSSLCLKTGKNIPSQSDFKNPLGRMEEITLEELQQKKRERFPESQYNG